jgi:hypothetical protein
MLSEVQENAQSKGLSFKKRRHAMNIDEFDSLDDILGRTEYAVQRNRAIAVSAATNVQKLCGSCHEVCLRCNGPTESDCLTCDADYNQIIIGSKITCHSKASVERPKASTPGNNDDDIKLNVITNQLRNYSTEKIVLISSIVGISLMLTSICIYLLFTRCRFYDNAKQFLGRASGSTSGTATEREKYSYNIVEMEETSPLTNVLPSDFQINDDDDDSDLE